MHSLSKNTYFITGIGTNVGKTFFSAIITEALNADYWKPIQSGDLDFSDTMNVKNLISNKKSIFHSEIYKLHTPVSPHESAKIDGIEISLEKIKKPKTNNSLIIEGAGGLFVPLNENEFIIDLIKKLGTEVILVSQNYLGSINHTLLSYQTLKTYNINIKGIVFNGDNNKSTEKFILDYTQLPCLLRIKNEINISKRVVKNYADILAKELNK